MKKSHPSMGFSRCTNMFLVLIGICFYFSDVCVAIDTITSSQFIKDPDTLSSNGGNFTFGFFGPENSTNRYVGIWWQPRFTVMWVANRNQPLKNSSGIIVTISEDGNLVVLNGHKHVIWSTNASHIGSSFNSSVKLLDSGNLVLLESTTGNIIWQSFEHPSDSFLAGMKLASNKNTGERVKLTSWESPSNPSIGSFSVSVERLDIPEVFIWNETRPYWRSGPWNGKIFMGIPTMRTFYLGGLVVGDDGHGMIELSGIGVAAAGFVYFELNSEGNCQEKAWNVENKDWHVRWSTHQTDCDVYGLCGPFAICSSQNSPICSCLKGFEPRNIIEWNRQNWTSGCARKTPLQCEKINNNKTDGFMKLQMIKVPDFADGSSLTLPLDTCRSRCLDNCSCIAYSYDAQIGCMSWTENLIDIRQFSVGGLDLYIRVANTELLIIDHDEKGKMTVIVTIIVTIGTTIISTCAYIMWRRNSKNRVRRKNSKAFPQINRGQASAQHTSDHVMSQVKFQELLIFSFEKIATATNNFDLPNKLGQGGFGPVYKGELEDGQEIAVKRLSRASRQGQQELMNEVVVISKLQHRNLVRLLGCCIEGEENMLIYEYMPNKSLDAFVFDSSRKKLLDWRRRFSIIEGISRGLLYLHRDSRLKIIHRDLKASNILLDKELNPKISDFGLARIFGMSEDEGNTERVAGTYGYMSPEYAMQGMFSEKSDVFSFGVLLLEIVSGRRNSSFCDSENVLTLPGVAWMQWTEDNILSIIDPEIYEPSFHNYMFRCIHIGLLCVQDIAADRPSMATVISMLNSEIVDLPSPRQPLFIQRHTVSSSMSSEVNNNALHSLNTVSVSEIYGR